MKPYLPDVLEIVAPPCLPGTISTEHVVAREQVRTDCEAAGTCHACAVGAAARRCSIAAKRGWVGGGDSEVLRQERGGWGEGGGGAGRNPGQQRKPAPRLRMATGSRFTLHYFAQSPHGIASCSRCAEFLWLGRCTAALSIAAYGQ